MMNVCWFLKQFVSFNGDCQRFAAKSWQGLKVECLDLESKADERKERKKSYSALLAF
jgi:hypothetical protein